MLDLEVTPLASGPAWPEGGREARHVAFTYPVPPARWTAADLRAVMQKAARLVPTSTPVAAVQSVSWAEDGTFELALALGERPSGDGAEYAATVRADRVSASDVRRVGGVRWSLLHGGW